jgi:hypothetical protein
MNVENIERRFERILLIIVFCYVTRPELSIGWQLGFLIGAFGYAAFIEVLRSSSSSSSATKAARNDDSGCGA